MHRDHAKLQLLHLAAGWSHFGLALEQAVDLLLLLLVFDDQVLDARPGEQALQNGQRVAIDEEHLSGWLEAVEVARNGHCIGAHLVKDDVVTDRCGCEGERRNRIRSMD